jgi:hypothetical protein
MASLLSHFSRVSCFNIDEENNSGEMAAIAGETVAEGVGFSSHNLGRAASPRALDRSPQIQESNDQDHSYL